MRKTYEELKQADDLKIADWFNPTLPNYVMSFSSHDRENFEIIRETEKAVQIEIEKETRDGEHDVTIKTWIPKACFESKGDYEKAYWTRIEKYEQACEKYTKLVNWCKENHVKGARAGLKTATLMSLIAKAGLIYSN